MFGHFAQFDIWVPEYNLAIEYQGEYVLCINFPGEHHFQDITGFGNGGTLSNNIARDVVKQNLAKEQNINFLTIPYWYDKNVLQMFIYRWDGSVSSLGATLNHHFPHLFLKLPEVGIVISSIKPILTKKQRQQ